jgi:transcriptional regulator with XRE-family HTH domain
MNETMSHTARLRSVRRGLDLTLADVAAALQTTPQTISRIENGIIALSAHWLKKFSRLYGVAASDLLGQSSARDIPQLGLADAFGRISRHTSNESFILSVPADQPVAVQLSTPLGGVSIRRCSDRRPNPSRKHGNSP